MLNKLFMILYNPDMVLMFEVGYRHNLASTNNCEPVYARSQEQNCEAAFSNSKIQRVKCSQNSVPHKLLEIRSRLMYSYFTSMII